MKKIIALFCLCLLFGAKNSYANTIFSDVKEDSELHYAITELKGKSVISGYSDQTFRPNTEVTRGQLAKMIAVSLNLTANGTTLEFQDVPQTHSNYHYIQALVSNGIISGYTDGTFKPNAPVTRAQAAKMLAKAYQVPNYDATLPFSDIKLTSERYNDIQALYFNGIAAGTTSTTYSPNKNVTRGQAALFIFRALQLKNGAAIIELNINSLQKMNIEILEGYFYKAVIVDNKIRLLPLINGEGKLLIKGLSANSSVPKTDYALYSITVKDKKITTTSLQWLDYIEHELKYYTFQQLGIAFKPTKATLIDDYGATVSSDYFNVGANDNGLDIAIFIPGTFTLKIDGSNTSKSFKIVSSVNGFKLSHTLYTN